MNTKSIKLLSYDHLWFELTLLNNIIQYLPFANGTSFEIPTSKLYSEAFHNWEMNRLYELTDMIFQRWKNEKAINIFQYTDDAYKLAINKEALHALSEELTKEKKRRNTKRETYCWIENSTFQIKLSNGSIDILDFKTTNNSMFKLFDMMFGQWKKEATSDGNWLSAHIQESDFRNALEGKVSNYSKEWLKNTIANIRKRLQTSNLERLFLYQEDLTDIHFRYATYNKIRPSYTFLLFSSCLNCYLDF